MFDIMPQICYSIKTSKVVIGYCGYKVSACIYNLRQLAYYIHCNPRCTLCVDRLCCSRKCRVRTYRD